MKKRGLFIILSGFVVSIVMLPSFMFGLKLIDNSKYFKPSSSATTLTDSIHKKVPEQENELDNVTSKYACKDLSLGSTSNFTITKTLCFIKEHINDYIQYAVYIGLVGATIFLILNGLKIVTAPDKEKQIGVFTKNLKYIIIGIVLITCFYMIIDIFVSVVNLITN